MFGKGFFVIMSVVSVGLLAVACTGKGGGESVTTATPSPTVETPATTPEPTVTPEPTSEPIPEPIPQPTQTPPSLDLPSDNPGPGSCAVFEKKYCSKGIALDPGPVKLGFRIPPGVSIFAPFDGYLVIPPDIDVMHYIYVVSDSMKFLIQGDFKVVRGPGPVRKGQLLAITTDPEKPYFEDYKIKLHIAKYYAESPTSGKYIPDKDLLIQYFPQYERYVPDTERRPRPYQSFY
jgi:hypothetical protein